MRTARSAAVRGTGRGRAALPSFDLREDKVLLEGFSASAVIDFRPDTVLRSVQYMLKYLLAGLTHQWEQQQAGIHCSEVC